MKDTILKMLENEPLVKKAFLLLLDETPKDKQDELLKAINASFEKGEPYQALGTASILEEDSYSKWSDVIHNLDMSIITNYDDTADKFEARIKELKEKLND